MQAPFCFLTLNMEEVHNPRSIRACAKTVDNKHFPAIFENGCPYGKDGTEFMEYLQSIGETVGEGQIDFSAPARAKMAMDDPITFVEETKQMLNDVCSILLGIPPEDYYAALESKSRRKTRYFKCNKGVFGNCLAYVGVTEDHKKVRIMPVLLSPPLWTTSPHQHVLLAFQQGTLHFHFLIFGGISSYAMQRFAAMSDVCAEISKVLDSMFNSSIPSSHHLPALIHKLAEERKVPLTLGLRSREVLLGRPTHLAAAGSNKRITHETLKQATYDQASRQCHHRHMQTCRKGYHGRVGCRLCMKAGKCNKTGCVLLRELSQKQAEELARSLKAPCWCSIPDDAFLPPNHHEPNQNKSGEDINDCNDDQSCTSDMEIESLTTKSVKSTTHDACESEKFFCENKGKTIGIAFEATRNIPPDLLPATYSVINILEKTKPPPLIVWETGRKPPEQILQHPQAGEPPLTKEQIIDQLKKNLDTVKEFSASHEIWSELENMSEPDLRNFYTKLVDAFATANQYIASYNPSISYCTGAHNNAVLLGGDQQAKAATFYLCPYMGKLKFPLQDCLVILQETLDHVAKYPSVAEDTGTDKRTSKHILQRCLNKLNLQMELSGTPFTCLRS